MQLRQIEVFHAVMITGSTVAAAKLLGVSQPAVSTTLKRMQDELGMDLFTVAGGRLVPTPEANALFAQAHAIQEDIGNLRRLAKMLGRGKIGSVRIGVVPAVSEGVLARAIAQIRREAPELVISVDVLNSHDLVNRLVGGRLDLACVFGTEHNLPTQVYQQWSVPLRIVAPKGMIERTGPLTLGEMTRYPVAAMRPTDPIGRLLTGRAEMEGASFDPIVELRSSRGVLALARAGSAIGVVDVITLGDLPQDNLDVRDLMPHAAVELRLVFKSGHSQSKAEARALQCLSTSISEALRQ